MKNDTSWGNVADWYDEYLQGEGSADSYQRAVILPNLMRMLDAKAGDRIIDVACGQGFFSEEIAAKKADIVGVDISPELIEKAKKRFAEKKLKGRFIVSPADNLSALEKGSANKVVCVLAAQNIKELDAMFGEAARVLKKGGKFLIVLNHPAFRVPQASDWHFESNKQGRVVYQYLSEGVIKIDMHPGAATKQKQFTYSYHRPLQVFVKWLSKRGFAITRLEEWISHKKSVPGPRAKAEDAARKEIPMFICIEATLL